MSVRIQLGGSPGEWPDAGSGYQPDPFLDRVPDSQDVRSVFAGAELDPAIDAPPSGDRDVARPMRGALWDRLRQRDWSRLVAGGLIGALGLAVLGVLVLRLATPPAGAPVTAAAAVAPTPSPSRVVPVEEATAGEAPLNDITAVSWQGAALPVSERAGPRVYTTIRSYGFSHDPLGAALAAVHLSTHLDPYTGPKVFEPAIREQVSDAPDGLLAATRQAYQTAAQTSGLRPGAIQRGDPVLAPTGSITAWRIPAYSSDSVVTVELLVQAPQGDHVVYQVPVAWRGGDWKLSLAGASPGHLFDVTEPTRQRTFTPFMTGGTTQ